ncbi:MAG TPA: VOC family protein [Kofleriaceae bacterium]|nr:VOC family protein [Kofleriaceae bacterium]
MSNAAATNAAATNAAVTPELVHWFEIPVSDLSKATAFYEAMLDTKLIQHAEDGVAQAMVPNALQTAPCGALFADPTRPPRRGHGTVVYLLARGGVKRTLARAVEAGGKVVKHATPIPPNGTIALVEDPDGNLIGLHDEHA